MASLNIWIDQIESMHDALPPSLKSAIVSHFEYYWSHDRLRGVEKQYWEESPDEFSELPEGYLSELPEPTAYRLLNYLFGDIFYRFRKFFGPINETGAFCHAICIHLQPRTWGFQEIILEEGTFA
jgi:hypothetical protein